MRNSYDNGSLFNQVKDDAGYRSAKSSSVLVTLLLLGITIATVLAVTNFF
jgi:hypothetical protein